MVSSSNGQDAALFRRRRILLRRTRNYMYYLYILKSGIKDWHYIGTTKDLQNRLAEHNAGEVKSTKAYKPFKIIYTESFPLKTEARKREIFLKKNSRARRDIFLQHGLVV